MATLDTTEHVHIISVTRSVEGMDQVIKWYVPKTSFMTVISWPSDELDENDIAKIDGPAASDGNFYWIHVQPRFDHLLDEDPPKSTTIWLKNAEEASSLINLLP
jgi:hypothetical protein